MAKVEDFESAIERYHDAAREFVKGNPEPYEAMFSQQDDVTLGNPFGPFVRGWRDASATMERAATLYRDGQVTEFETVAKLVTPELAYIVEVERIRAKMGGAGELANVTLRTTSVLRPEDGTWKIVHRHADPIDSPRSVDSVIGK
jgi:ketosteroid isomerase-like protein